jgi:hypothetical protein
MGSQQVRQKVSLRGRKGKAYVAAAILCFLLITLIFLQSPFLQQLLGALILILAYLFGAAG